MSFQEQERALFDLLFDANLRNRFCVDGSAALAGYRLSQEEQHDFSTILPSGLQIDAQLRRDQILQQYSLQLPATFALLAALPGGRGLLEQLVNTTTMRAPADERCSRFAQQLREALQSQRSAVKFESAQQQTVIGALIDAECTLAWSSAALKNSVLQQLELDRETSSKTDQINPQFSTELTHTAPENLPADWRDRPVTLAANVAAFLLPLSYTGLKQALMSIYSPFNWQTLREQPPTPNQLQELLGHEQPTLFISRAVVTKANHYQVRVDHQTVELNDGFAPLLQQIDSNTNVNHLVNELKKLGSSEAIIDRVTDGFQQLASCGIIEFD